MPFTHKSLRELPVIDRVEDFDQKSGGLIERAIFGHRKLLIVLCIILTGFLGWRASCLSVNVNFDKMIPQSNPYILNYFNNRSHLKGLGNAVRIVVQTTQGNIFNPQYLQVIQKINDKVFLIPGVDRPSMKSLWTPGVQWMKITEKGFESGPVMPPSYNGTPQSIAQLRVNIGRAGIIGSLVGNDMKSSTIFVPLLSKNPYNGKPLDYRALWQTFEGIRHKYQSDKIHIRIVGFAELSGDLIAGLYKIIYFFIISVLVVGGMIFFYTRCLRSTLLVIGVSLVSVVWLLGIIELLGYVIDPYSSLVPFLVFAIGCSHGTQKMNGVMQDIARGTHRYVASRYTFRRLFSAGLTAILCNMVGFAVLTVIDVPAIRDLAFMTSIGVAILIFAVLMLVPVVLSYTGVSAKAAARRLRVEQRQLQPEHAALEQRALLRFTGRRWAILAIVVAAVICGAAFVTSEHLQVGDLGRGAPELWPNSQYNRDAAYINAHYSRSSDVFAVIVTTPHNGCEKFKTLIGMDRLGQQLRALPGVQSVVSSATVMRYITSALYDGTPKWLTINRRPAVLRQSLDYIRATHPDLVNETCTVAPIIVYLADHRAQTLTHVMNTVVRFNQSYHTTRLHFLPAAGSSGIQAITNIVVRQANIRMLLLLYGATALLCLLAFRSWRAVLVALIPLLITSVFCEALMVELNIGLKVATLPVTALAVGVGVDYALYLLSVQLEAQRSGATLRDAYRYALGFTGKVVLLIGFTMAVSVVTWYWSPIKFQADMGILLTAMFLWNIVGALVMVPALSWVFLRKVGTTSKSENS